MSALARECGALLVVDNTFLTPLLQQPLSLGADIVVHSTTKYINGHSDVVGGAVVAKTPALLEELAWWANCVGSTASPWDCAQTMRGLRTLHARLRCHEENTQAIVRVLDAHSAVRRVHYPGLSKHPDQHLVRAQQTGFGAIISFELRWGRRPCAGIPGRLVPVYPGRFLGRLESWCCIPAPEPCGNEQDANVQRVLKHSVHGDGAIEPIADLIANSRGLGDPELRIP